MPESFVQLMEEPTFQRLSCATPTVVHVRSAEPMGSTTRSISPAIASERRAVWPGCENPLKLMLATLPLKVRLKPMSL